MLVLGATTHGALGITRSLGELGVPVYSTYRDSPGPACFSRYCRERFRWSLSNSDAQSLPSLLRIGERIGRKTILIPTWDETAVFVAEHRSQLERWFVTPAQPKALPAELVSKKKMHWLATKHGIPTAKVTFPKSLHEVQAFAERGTFPVMLKGIDGNRLYERSGKKMVIALSPSELLHWYRVLDSPGEPNLMLQEYIPAGPNTDWMFNGYFNEHSQCLMGITGRKIRQTPVYTGMTSLGICESNPTVFECTTRWMKQLGYRGILDIGYRFDHRDGKYKVLDVNPRIGATFRLFVAQNGLDVARALYLDLTRQTVPSSTCVEGRKWMVELDLKSCLDYWRDGNLTLREWLRSLWRIEEFGYFRVGDLLPFWKFLGLAIRKFRAGHDFAASWASASSQETDQSTAKACPTIESPIYCQGHAAGVEPNS